MHFTALPTGGGPATVTDMTVQLTRPGEDLPPFTVPLQKLGAGHYYAPLYDIPYSGKWQMTVRVQLGADQRGRADQSVHRALTCREALMPDVDVATNFFLVLTLVADAVVVVRGRVRDRGAGVAACARVGGVAGPRAVAPQSVVFAWIVATVTTLGSLYYSEHAGFVPCELCWYQRIVMYPLVIVLGVAALRRDRAGVDDRARVRRHRRAAVAVPLAGRAGAGVRGEQLVLGDHAVQRAVVREARLRHAGVDGDERVPADRRADGVHVGRRPRSGRRASTGTTGMETA